MGVGCILANQFVKMTSRPSQELKQVLNNLLMMVTSFCQAICSSDGSLNLTPAFSFMDTDNFCFLATSLEINLILPVCKLRGLAPR